jgi:hypothetical protein
VSVLGVGVTQGYSYHDAIANQDLVFPDLPGVGRELAGIVCIPTKTISDSDVNRSPIPIESDRRFRLKPITMW